MRRKEHHPSAGT